MPPVAPICNWEATSATLAFVFAVWHVWNYDQFRCLVYRKEDWFRTFIIHVQIVGCAFFVTSEWIDVHVVYDQDFMLMGSEVVTTPYQFWPNNLQVMYKVSAYLLTMMFWTLHISHAEEMIFWGYLIRAIRNPNYACAPTPRTWLHAPCFRVWLSVSLFSGALIWGAINIETENIDIQRAYLYLISGCISLLLSFGSLVMCIYLPSFIQRIKDFGAGFEMQERLAVFKELNMIRFIARVFYSIAFIMLSADVLTTDKVIAKSKFAQSFVAVAGQCGLITVFGLSVIILLPRNMTLESAAPHSQTSFHPMMSAYKRPTPDRLANHHFWEMGQRLNLEQDALAAILPDRQGAPAHNVAGHTHELSYSTSNHQLPQNQRPDAGEENGRRASVKNIQEMMGRLVGMESQRATMPPPPARIIVTTHEEQRSD